MKMLIFSKIKKNLEKSFFLTLLKIYTFSSIFEGLFQDFENTFLHTTFLSCRKPPNLLQMKSLEGI